MVLRSCSIWGLFIGLNLICLPLLGQIQSSIQLNYNSAHEDSLILARENDTLSHYRFLYLSDPANHSALNSYLEAFNRCYRIDSLDLYLPRFTETYTEWEEELEQARFLLAWADAAEYNSLFDSSESLFRRLVEDSSFHEFPEQMAKGHFKLGVVHRLKGEYYLSTKHFQEALDRYSVLEDSTRIYESDFQIGILDLIQGDSLGFEASYQRANRFFASQPDSANLALTYSIRSIFLNNHGQAAEGLEYARKSLDIRYALEDVRGQAESLNNAAINIMALGDLERGRTLINEALRKFKAGNYLLFVPTLLNNLGRMMVRSGELEGAMPLYEEALITAQSRNQKHDIIFSHMRIARLCARQGDFACAYESLNQYIKLNSEILGKRELAKVNDLRAKYEDEQTNRELAFLKREKEIVRVRDLVVIVSLIVLLLAAIIVIVMIRMRSQQKRKILEAQESQARQELQLAEQRLEASKDRLKDFVSRVVEKTRLVEELQSQVQELEEKVSIKDEKRLEFESQLGTLRILTQEDWDQFRTLFRNAHPGFLDRLSTEFPQLSKGETRIFVLIYLDLTTQEAAAMLGISPAAVKKARYRLKKKMDLDESSDLKGFIKSF